MASNNAIILAAAMSEVTSNRVITHNDYITRKLGNVRYQEMDTNALHQSHLVGGPVPNNIQNLNIQQPNPTINNNNNDNNNNNNNGEITLSIKPLSGKAFKIRVNPTDTIYQVKQKIQDEQGILPEVQRLLFQGNQLENGRSVTSCEIQDNTEIFLVLRQRGGDEIYFIHSDHLDPQYDCDFTTIRDTGKTFMRGPFEYKRPCGWNRIALNVLNKYGENVWLGVGGIRRSGTASCQNEWPVSYHGTSRHNNNTIADDGFNFAGNKNFNFTHGIYSTPDVNVALKYATRFAHEGNNYAVLFQNRVNPVNLERITNQETGGAGEYWISRNGGDVRSYGICIKKI